MASTDLVTPSRRLIYIGDVEANRPNSESINQKIMGNINFVLERLVIDMPMVFGGYFNANNFDNGAGGIFYVENNSIVSMYNLGIHKTGASGTSSFNVAVYDETGAFVNNLFGSGGNALSVSGSNGTNVMIGKRKIDTLTPANIGINTAGHTVFNGNLNLGTVATPLLAGYMLVPFIVSNASKAYNLTFNLRLKEL